jgi:chloramphenicol 3-O-phosphotransferase
MPENIVPPDKPYTLLGPDQVPYLSRTPGQYGGHRAGRRYGKLDCPSAARALARGGYVSNRVFFADEATAIAAGYRPCAVCLPEQYRQWKAGTAARLHVITGISASGKTTIGRLLADRFSPSAFIEGDVVRLMVRRGRVEMASTTTAEMLAQLRLRYRQITALADTYIDAGYHVVVEDVIIGAVLPEFLGLLRTRPLHLVVLCPDPGVVATRESARQKTGYGPRWNVEQLDRALRTETARIGHWLDTSEQTPDETVDAILKNPQRSLITGSH